MLTLNIYFYQLDDLKSFFTLQEKKCITYCNLCYCIQWRMQFCFMWRAPPSLSIKRKFCFEYNRHFFSLGFKPFLSISTPLIASQLLSVNIYLSKWFYSNIIRRVINDDAVLIRKLNMFIFHHLILSLSYQCMCSHL